MPSIETLWSIRGSNPVAWTIPFYVVQHDDKPECDMFCAIQLLPSQEKAVDAVLSDHARPYNAAWKILPFELAAIGNPTAGGDPEDYFSWALRLSTHDKEREDERRQERNEFIDALHQTGVATRGEVEAWWILFCNHALDWMLNKGKPVDMGFIRLHPSPYRRNWKECLLERLWRLIFYRLGYKLRNKSWKKLITDRFKSPAILAFDASKICLRYVEVEHRMAWFKNMRIVETARKEQLGMDYMPYVFETIQRRLKTSFRLFRLWAMDCATPLAKPVQSSPGRRWCFTQAEAFQARRYEWIQSNSVSHLVTRAWPRKNPHSQPRAVSATNGDVPEVRPVLGDEGMRDTGDGV